VAESDAKINYEALEALDKLLDISEVTISYK